MKKLRRKHNFVAMALAASMVVTPAILSTNGVLAATGSPASTAVDASYPSISAKPIEKLTDFKYSHMSELLSNEDVEE